MKQSATLFWNGAAVAAVVLLAATASADKVITKTGEAFTGTIVETDGEKIVLKTLSGTLTIPRESVKSVEMSEPTGGTSGDTKPAGPPEVVPATIDPAKAADALAAAKSALVSGEWVKAASLLEGLTALDEKAFDAESRLAATGALVTCYLQLKDAQGAARSLARRAQLAPDPNDKRRLAAAAEALRALGSVVVDGKSFTRYEEVVEAAMKWKADQVLKEAKDLATRAQRLNEPGQLEKAATGILKKLAEADVFVPGYSASHKQSALEGLVINVIEGARAAVAYCEKVRPELTAMKNNLSVAGAQAFNAKARPYLATRQAAEDALRMLKTFGAKMELPGLLSPFADDITKLLADLDEYQYYPKGTPLYPPGYYGYYYYSRPSTERVKIQLRQIG